MSDEYMTFEQASTFLNTPRSTLYRWLKEGKVPGHKLGRQWRFLRTELEALRSQPVEHTISDDDASGGPLAALEALLMSTTPKEAREMMMQLSIQENLMWHAYDQGATALHVQPQPDGQWAMTQRNAAGLEEITTLSAEAFEALIDAIEADIPPEFRGAVGVRGAWKMTRGEDHLLVQHQQLTTALGPYWTFRLIRTHRTTHPLEEVVEHPQDLEALTRFIQATHGLVLIAGPSGSGKTTTAYGCLQALANRGDRVIFTLEPSTEFLIPGVNQVEVDLNDDRAYRQAFSQVMHSDPDVLFLSSTYAPRHRNLIYTTALNAAESGHLVFVQLEADGAEDALARFQSHVERPVDDWVVGVVWQELVRQAGQSTRARYDILPGPLDVEV